ncbi:slit homolog 2 protein-like isoform X2 [Watersipora subatra]|uniref:slit homolog 2 protein-like isoform X2 n=1 Tax=Watersipora subatra TaxID=2589382 RepID=UPI00355C297E
MGWKMSWIIITFIIWINYSVGDIACPRKCMCGKTSIDCSFKGFTSIPDGLDPDTESLDFQGNNITVIRKEYFIGLRKLTNLQLLDNNIGIIEPRAFDDLVNLESLRLGRNRLQELSENLFANSPHITRLDLSRNALHLIRASTLQGLSKLTELYLDHNELSCIETEVLGDVPKLQIISLNRNNLTSLPSGLFNNLPDLRILRLSDNSFHCDCNLGWLGRWLKMNRRVARFTKCTSPPALNRVMLTEIQQSQYQCTGDSKLATSPIKCQTINTCPSKCNCTVNGVVNCRNVGLLAIPADIPENVRDLRLDQNDITSVPADSFAALKQLDSLDLSNNRISNVSAAAFSRLTGLKKLILYENLVSELPAGIFSGLTSLQMLLLNANKISCLRADIFEGLSQLHLLSLFDNEITTIVNGTFQPLVKLQTLHLASNPFRCDCNLMWIAEYLQRNPVETSGAKCVSPNNLEKRRLESLREESRECWNVATNSLLATCDLRVECPSECACRGTTVDCSGMDLMEIPENIPPFVTELNLSDNDITAIPTRAFAHLQHLQKLDLANNKINRIENNAFEGAGRLAELQMTENQLTRLRREMFTGLTGLRTLMLRENQVTCIDNSTFTNMPDLRLLSLYDNKISCLQPGSFSSLPLLSTLNLLRNPLHCDCHMQWLSTWLRLKSSSIVTGNPTCESPSSVQNSLVSRLRTNEFVCAVSSVEGCQQTTPQCCSDNTNVVQTCHPPSVCPRGCTCRETEVRCSGLGLSQIPANIPPETTELDLSNNRLQHIASHQFSNLTRLTTLILSYNDIKCMQEDSFSNLKQLKRLNLYSNDLSTIPFNSFKDLDSLVNIVLGENPLWCDCNLKWLADWIKEDYKENGVAKCEGPSLLERKLLLTTPSSMFQCTEGYNSSHILQKCDACRGNPCRNNGECESLGFDYFKCNCKPGFYGLMCHQEIDACFGNPCENEGTCSATGGRFECNCKPGFSGFMCEINDDDCDDNGCQNGATCIDLVQGYECRCPYGFTGRMCEVDLNLCDELKPCRNGAECVALAQDYSCDCPVGFTGKNCSTNIDDCVDNICQNGAHCIDGLGEYSCECLIGYTGKYCAVLSQLVPDYLQSSVCQNSDCKNDGVCFQPPKSSEYVCRCQSGYVGKKCEKLQSVSFVQDSFVQAPGLNFSSRHNITVVFTTQQDKGLLFHQGRNSHIAAELYYGRVRVSFSPDDAQYNNLLSYSYTTVNDSELHTLTIIIDGVQVSMYVDGSQPNIITSSSNRKYIRGTSNLFIGGLPKDIGARAKNLLQISSTESFKGCVHALHINEKRLDFESANLVNNKLLPGCREQTSIHDVCRNSDCVHGTCQQNKKADGYACACDKDYSGTRCDQRRPSCVATSYKEYYVDPNTGCKSKGKVKLRRCEGDEYCQVKKTRKKTIRMECKDTATYMKDIELPRKCSRTKRKHD